MSTETVQTSDVGAEMTHQKSEFADEGIGSLVIGLQGITEFMSGVGSKVKRYDPLPYPNECFEDVLEENMKHLANAQSLPINHLVTTTKRILLPAHPIECNIIEAVRLTHFSDFDFQSNYIYVIRIHHGMFVWTIKRRYRHFYLLHKHLYKLIRRHIGEEASIYFHNKNVDAMDVPKLPMPPDTMARIDSSNVRERMLALENYLTMILKHAWLRDKDPTREFLEMSAVSFIEDLGPRFKEGKLKKRSFDDGTGKRFRLLFPIICGRCKFHHTDKWFFLKDTYMGYIRMETGQLGFPMLIDNMFTIKSGFRKTRVQRGLKITNLQRKMVLRAHSERDRQEWLTALSRAIETASGFSKPGRFQSFAPVRPKCLAKWYINGKDYMSDLADALSKAQEQIFITDWWMSPEIYLKRPACGDDKTWRLDHLLELKAGEGVKVYVLLYKEKQISLSIDSMHTKKTLMQLRNNKNIEIMRHPDTSDLSAIFWSHHEKTVVIDQKIAFVGGIDLCFGRWDDGEYRIVDDPNNNKDLRLPGEKRSAAEPTVAATFSEPRQIRMHSQNAFLESMINPNPERLQVAMEHRPSRLATFARSRTTATSDATVPRRGCEEEGTKKRWDFVKNAVRTNQIAKPSKAEKHEDSDEEAEHPEVNRATYEQKDNTTGIMWRGKDYSNSYLADFKEVHKFSEDGLNRTREHRMPWHDEASVVVGDAALDVGRHFIQRWNYTKKERKRLNAEYHYLLPKAYTEDPPDDSLVPGLHDSTVQVVRSLGNWSAGTTTFESSIANAYNIMIQDAKHYIFIENQFFISLIGDKRVTNPISKALYSRITRAHRAGEKFRVFVIIPLLPGFDAEDAMKAVQHFTMQSIAVGDKCLYEQLRVEGGVSNPEDYITFHGMRKWDVLNGELRTEIIYVHSKLMIVDDCRAIVGSANINDRSLLGHRDSEVALVIEDNRFIKGRMNGQPVQVGRLISAWRKQLFKEALGIGTCEVAMNFSSDDPICDEFYQGFKSVSKNNTDVFFKIFHAQPNDQCITVNQVTQMESSSNPAKEDPVKSILILQKEIQGYIVDLPHRYLAAENIYPEWDTKEGFVPTIVWT